MRFLLDENVPFPLLHWLERTGYDARRVPQGLQDNQVIELARKELRILVTLDKDFANCLMYPPRENEGIAVLRIHPPRKENLIKAMQLLLDDISGKTLKGKLAIVEETGYQLLS